MNAVAGLCALWIRGHQQFWWSAGIPVRTALNSSPFLLMWTRFEPARRIIILVPFYQPSATILFIRQRKSLFSIIHAYNVWQRTSQYVFQLIMKSVESRFGADTGIASSTIHPTRHCGTAASRKCLPPVLCGWLLSRQSIKAGVRGKRVSVRPYYMRMTVMDCLRATVGASFLAPTLRLSEQTSLMSHAVSNSSLSLSLFYLSLWLQKQFATSCP